jgi:hypothetical protein
LTSHTSTLLVRACVPNGTVAMGSLPASARAVSTHLGRSAHSPRHERMVQVVTPSPQCEATKTACGARNRGSSLSRMPSGAERRKQQRESR